MYLFRSRSQQQQEIMHDCRTRAVPNYEFTILHAYQYKSVLPYKQDGCEGIYLVSDVAGPGRTRPGRGI